MWRLRPLDPGEHEWAYALHEAALRESVTATLGWDEADQRGMLAEALASRPRPVIEHEGRPVGILVTEDRPGTLYVALIALAPEWQGRGIGTAILRDLRTRAHESGRELALSVQRGNPRALALYERAGLRVVAREERKLHLRG